MGKEELKELCKYERIMFVNRNIDSEVGREEVHRSITRLIDYIGKKNLSILLNCKRDEIELNLREMIMNI